MFFLFINKCLVDAKIHAGDWHSSLGQFTADQIRHTQYYQNIASFVKECGKKYN